MSENNTRIALVTGANRGIGLEVCRQLLEHGYRVILGSRDEAKDKKAVAGLSASSEMLSYHQLDVSNQESISELFYYLKQNFGRLDVLINNAGINYDSGNTALKADLEECRQTLEVNLFGAWKMTQLAVPLMREHKYGRIVNVSSGSGAITHMGAGTPVYSISKAALNVLTIKLAAETSEENILINSVCPGWVRTDMGGQAAPRSVEEGASGIVWAATLKDDGPSGGFFRDGKPIAW